MATGCRNCGAALVFRPEMGRLYCSKCGSTFTPEEVEDVNKELLEDVDAVAMKDVMGYDDKSFMDCNVYTCEHCGGEIMVTDTEASTYCIYCGNPTVVFSRIAKQKRPEFILPFSVTEDQALQLVRDRIKRGFFIPPSLKKVKIENIRGIYIPYWIVNAHHQNAVFFSGKVKRGKNYVTRYYERAGTCEIENLPLDASVKLNDDSSSRLEPFNLAKLKEFNEDYLSGFYSDMADVTKGDIRMAAAKRADQMFIAEAAKSVKARDVKMITNSSDTKIEGTPVYAMLPAWFVTFEYKGKPHTVLVNGSTGKMVCALPWSKALFYTLVILVGLIIAAAAAFVLYWIVASGMGGHHRSSSGSNGTGRAIAMIIGLGITGFSIGIKKYKNVIDKMKLTQSARTMDFVKRRQG